MAIRPIADDFPDEFKQPNIEGFVAAFDKQIAELVTVMNQATIVAIDDASGITLDWIGERVGLTRLQATERVTTPGSYPVDDDDYRKLLKQQIIKNSSNCNLDDVLKCILEWDENGGADNDSVHPATIIVSGDATRDMLPIAAGVNKIP